MRGKLPPAEQPEVSTTEMSEIIRKNMMIAELPKIDISDPEQVERRVNEYLALCERIGMRPQVSGLALSMGVTRQSIYNWRKPGDKRKKVIDKAMAFIETIINDWGLTGKLNPAVFCFLQKNWFGYQDQSQLELVQSQQTYETKMSPEEIAARIESDIPIDADYLESEPEPEPLQISENII